MVLCIGNFLFQVDTRILIPLDLSWSHDVSATHDDTEDVEYESLLKLHGLHVLDERARVDVLLSLVKWHIQLALNRFLLLILRFEPRLDCGRLAIMKLIKKISR